MTLEQEAALIAARHAYDTYELLDSQHGNRLICDCDLYHVPKCGDVLAPFDIEMLVVAVDGLRISIEYLLDDDDDLC